MAHFSSESCGGSCSRTRETVWTGWATRGDATVAVAALLDRGLPSSPDSRRGVRTVADLLNAWLHHQEQRLDGCQIAESTLTAYPKATAYWFAAVGDVSLRRLDRATVEDQITGWMAAGSAARTCKLAVDVLNSGWRWGVARELCPPLNLARLEALRIRKSERVYNSYTPTPDEIWRVLAQVTRPRNRNLLALQALTGARIGEVAALRVGDYDRQTGTLTLSGRDSSRGKRGKGEPRHFPALHDLRELLEELTDGRAPDSP